MRRVLIDSSFIIYMCEYCFFKVHLYLQLRIKTQTCTKLDK